MGLASSLGDYLWWPLAMVGLVVASTVFARLLLTHAEKFLLVFVGFLLYWLVSRPEEVIGPVRAVGGALVGLFWTVVAFGTWLAR